MAKVFPDGWRELTATGAAERELQTLARLADGLANDYTVYHGVHWTQVEHGSYAIHSRVPQGDFPLKGDRDLRGTSSLPRGGSPH